jgi:hypothetical protein
MFAHSRTRALSSLVLIAAALSFPGDLLAQVVDPPRTNYVFHIYVDPMFGDDARATARNPSTTAPTPPPVPQGQLRPLDRHPEAANPKPITGFLQHAPYPFQTLTGTNGALAWIDNNFRPAGTPATPFFPWKHPDSPERFVTQVVVHCLPGLYGPISEPSLPRLDSQSGLPFNGETWPAKLRDGVSLQGTSALDTIFDARGGYTAVIEVNEDRSPTGTYSHVQSFIDSLCIRGARSSAEPALGEGAGIYVQPRRTSGNAASSRLFITNCILTNNVVGVGLDSYSGVSEGTPARPRIINNTFAWNACGLWCGNTNSGGNSIHAPTVINNIFDSGSPAGNIGGSSGFEGLGAQDKQVASVGGTPLPPGSVDFNAWESSYINLGVPIGPGWPATTAQHTIPFQPARVDIQPYTRGAGGARAGSLYINDIFRNSPEGGTGAEYSSHDFRLAPNVSLTNAPPGATVPPLRNPLVNAGVDDAPPGSAKYPIAMGNGLSLNEPPGLSIGADEARIDGWDWSCEGFGNPRIYLRPGFVPRRYGPDPQFESYIDLGCHELGDLTMAGYLTSTRIFTRMGAAQGGVTLPDRGKVFYFNLIYDGSAYPPTSFPRPRMNAPVGWGSHWWPHVQNGPATDANDGNYTKLLLPPASDRWYLINALSSATNYNSIGRALQCDFSPNLLPDLHPYWGGVMQLYLPNPDVYGSSPWHERSVPPPGPPAYTTRDNPTLFHNVGGTVHSTPSGLFGYTMTGVQDATLNPPACYPGTNTWLIPPTAQFGPWSPCTGGNSYTIGTWGYGDAQPGCPDVIPPYSGLDALGIRFNCEVAELWSNLQSFLVVRSEEIPGENLTVQSISRLPRQPTHEEIEQHNQEASFRILDRFLKRLEGK